MSWPGTQGAERARVVFDRLSGGTFSTTRDGPWGWFRLLDEARLKTVHTPRRSPARDLQGVRPAGRRTSCGAASVANPFRSTGTRPGSLARRGCSPRARRDGGLLRQDAQPRRLRLRLGLATPFVRRWDAWLQEGPGGEPHPPRRCLAGCISHQPGVALRHSRRVPAPRRRGRACSSPVSTRSAANFR